MNHSRNAIRFAIVVFWIVVIGLAYTAFTHSGNIYALSWVTLLVYAVMAIVALYAGAVFTVKLWNVK